jgi:hypothetical protein
VGLKVLFLYINKFFSPTWKVSLYSALEIPVRFIVHLIVIAIVVALIYLAVDGYIAYVHVGAIPQNTPTSYNTFIWGILDGFLVAVNLFVSLFRHGTTIYQFPNSGTWYNLGFVMGISSFFGGGYSSRRASRRYL